MQLDLRYLVRDRDRHGNERVYVRRNGRKIRLKEPKGSQAFARAYSEALDALGAAAGPASTKAAPAGSLGWLAALYFGSSEFRGLAAKSQSTRRSVIEACLEEPRKPGSTDLMRECPVNLLTAVHIQMLRDRRQAHPGAANNRLKYLSAMFGWAVENHRRTGISSNPARDVRPIRYTSSGFYTWTDDDVRQFEAAHPIGTRARLALALLMFTGVRRQDMVTLGRQHVRDGKIRFVPLKTRYLRSDLSEKPMLPELERIIAASPTGDLAFLVTTYGRPFSDKGFGEWFRKQCDRAKLPQCTAHGLRKAAATRAAELGATDHQLMALFDWTSPSQAAVYTRAADKKRMAAQAMQMLSRDQTANADCPTEVSHRKI